MLRDWTFRGNLAWHIPCDKPGYRYFYNSKSITCSECKAELPEELELPAQVFKAFDELPPLNNTYFDFGSSFYISVGSSNYINFRLNSSPDSQTEE